MNNHGKREVSKIPKKNQKKPVLRINMAQTMDGHTVQADGKWALGSKEDKRRMDRLRLWADCLVASRKSIENDNPNLFARSKPGARHPVPVVVLKNIERQVSSSSRIFLEPHPAGEFWTFGESPPPIDEIVDMKTLCDEKNDKKLLERIKKWKTYSYKTVKDIYDSLVEKGFHKILLEGGPTLNGLFLKEDLIDEIFFTIEPYIWSGQTTDRIITTSETLSLKKFRLLTVERRKDEVFFRYKKII
jgi:5-amino-6-(5-phosphoribosylamino)uracil reductase